jgi:hypothetical protein
MKIYFAYGKEDAPEGFTKKTPDEVQSLEANSVEEVQGTGILEKVPDLVDFMDRLYYRLALGAKATFICGYYGCSSSFVSPLIKRPMSEYSMNWCSKAWREANKFTEVDTDIDFDVGAGLATDQALNLRNEETQVLWRTTRLNCVLQVHFTLTKK